MHRPNNCQDGTWTHARPETENLIGVGIGFADIITARYWSTDEKYDGLVDVPCF